MPNYFTSSHSHSWGRRSNGSMPTKIEILHGITVHYIPSQVLSHRQTNALRERISSFQQQHDESIPEAWERFQDYILECPYHGMENWLLMQTFYHRLTNSTRETMDAVLEVHSCHSHYQLQQLLWRRWPPTKAGMKNVFRPAREVEVCINSRRQTCCLLKWTC